VQFLAQPGYILAKLAHFLGDVVALVGVIAGSNFLGADIDLLRRDRESLEPELPAYDDAENRDDASAGDPAWDGAHELLGNGHAPSPD
jgi:hypothetical protein